MIRSDLREKLEAKGWDDESIEKAMKVFEKEKEKKGEILSKLDKLVYWVAMMISIAGNFIISIILIPFLITITNKIALSVIIFAISLSFGFLFNILLKDIEGIDEEHHIIAGVFIPALALINIFVITNVANHFITALNIQQSHNPFIIGVIYISAFITPYLIDKLLNKNIAKTQKNISKKEKNHE